MYRCPENMQTLEILMERLITAHNKFQKENTTNSQRNFKEELSTVFDFYTYGNNSEFSYVRQPDNYTKNSVAN